MRKSILLLASLLAACDDDSVLTRTEFTCPGTDIRVNDLGECPEPEVDERLFCPVNGIVSEVSSLTECDVQTFVCPDGSFTRDPDADCMRETVETCPEGSQMQNGICTCPTGTTIRFENGFEVTCPEPVVVNNDNYVCLGDTPRIVRDPNECEDIPDTIRCPFGSDMVGASCTCPAGETITLENGLTIDCPMSGGGGELPCEGLRVIDMMPETYIMGQRSHRPGLNEPEDFDSGRGFVQLRIEACDGSEIELVPNSIVGALTSSFYNWTVSFAVHSDGLRYYSDHPQMNTNNGINPNFGRNHYFNAFGEYVEDEYPRGHSLIVELINYGLFPEGTFVIDIHSIRARNLTTGQILETDPGFNLHRELIIQSDPCTWTDSPEIFIGDPTGYAEFFREAQSDSQNAEFGNWSIGSCIPARLTYLDVRFFNNEEYNQQPQVQADNSGHWFGTAIHESFPSSTIELAYSNGTTTSTTGMWRRDNHLNDIARTVKASLLDTSIFPGERIVFNGLLQINELLPRNTGVSDLYYVTPRNLTGVNPGENRPATRAVFWQEDELTIHR